MWFIDHMFGPFILPISFYFILFFHFFQPSKPFHSSPFFLIIFFNFSNSYTISLNLNHLYHLEIHKVKPFSKLFFKLFSKPFSNHLEWSKMTKIVSSNGGWVWAQLNYGRFNFIIIWLVQCNDVDHLKSCPIPKTCFVLL